MAYHHPMLFLLMASVTLLRGLSVSRSPTSFGEMRALLNQAARGESTAEAITVLQDLRDGKDAKAWQRWMDSMMHDRESMKSITSRARKVYSDYMLRFHIEQGNLKEATKALNQYKGVSTVRLDGPTSCVAEGDLYFSLGNYEKAISIYQDHVALGMDRSPHALCGNPFMDDILFSKIGLAHLTSGDT